MANYIAWYGKKREILHDREREFIALLETDAKPSQIAEAAEGIRAAQVRAVKSIRAELAPTEENKLAAGQLDAEIAYWLTLPVAEIIDGYRSGNGKRLRFSNER